MYYTCRQLKRSRDGMIKQGTQVDPLTLSVNLVIDVLRMNHTGPDWLRWMRTCRMNERISMMLPAHEMTLFRWDHRIMESCDIKIVDPRVIRRLLIEESFLPIASVAQCTAVTHLSITVTDPSADLEPLANMNELRYLTLTSDASGPLGIKVDFLSKLPSLRGLHLRGRGFDLPPFHSLRMLVELRLDAIDVDPVIWLSLTQLTKLALSFTGYTQQASTQFNALSPLVNLTSLHISRPFGRTQLGVIACFPKLKHLEIIDVQVTSLAAVGQCHQLETLIVHECPRISDFAFLCASPVLTTLSLIEVGSTLGLTIPLPPSLTTLCIHWMDVTSNAFSFLPNLKTLSFGFLHSKTPLDVISTMPQLRSLFIDAKDIPSIYTRDTDMTIRLGCNDTDAHTIHYNVIRVHGDGPVMYNWGSMND